MQREREPVAMPGSTGTVLEAIGELVGGVTATEHTDGDRAVRAVAQCLDDPVARVRRSGVHALTCEKCESGGACALDDDVRRRIAHGVQNDPSPKVRAEAGPGLAG